MKMHNAEAPQRRTAAKSDGSSKTGGTTRPPRSPNSSLATKRSTKQTAQNYKKEHRTYKIPTGGHARANSSKSHRGENEAQTQRSGHTVKQDNSQRAETDQIVEPHRNDCRPRKHS